MILKKGKMENIDREINTQNYTITNEQLRNINIKTDVAKKTEIYSPSLMCKFISSSI